MTGSYMYEFVAIEKGYHRDEGLAVEMIQAGGGVATQALIAGDLHFSTSAGSALGAMLRGADIRSHLYEHRPPRLPIVVRPARD